MALLSALLACSVSARAGTNEPMLSFSGTTAYCEVYCQGRTTSDDLTVNLTLRENGNPIAGWNGSGVGYVSMQKTCSVSSGKTYTLVLSYTINGVSQPSVSVTATCP